MAYWLNNIKFLFVLKAGVKTHQRECVNMGSLVISGTTLQSSHRLRSDPLDLPLDPGQKGVDGLRWIGY